MAVPVDDGRGRQRPRQQRQLVEAGDVALDVDAVDAERERDPDRALGPPAVAAQPLHLRRQPFQGGRLRAQDGDDVADRRDRLGRQPHDRAARLLVVAHTVSVEVAVTGGRLLRGTV